MTSGPAFRRFAFAYGAAFAIFYVVARARMGAFSYSGGGVSTTSSPTFGGAGSGCRTGASSSLVFRPVEAVSFVDRQALAQLSAGQFGVDQCRAALADDGGAVSLAARNPLQDARCADVDQPCEL